MPGAAPISSEAERFDVRLVKVETAVSGLFAALGEIKTGVESLRAGLSSKGQINWAALAIVAGLTVPALGWAWGQISALNVRIDSLSSKLEITASRFVSREDIKDKFEAAKEVADLKAQIASGKIERIAADIGDIQSKIVPLSAHQELWAAQHEANKALAAQIDENRKALADISAPSDTISRIYKRLDDVEGLARSHSPGRPD